MLKVGNLEKKGFVIVNKDELKTILGYAKASQKEMMTATSLLGTLPDACDNDPYKDARFFVATGSAKKAQGYLAALIKMIEGNG